MNEELEKKGNEASDNEHSLGISNKNLEEFFHDESGSKPVEEEPPSMDKHEGLKADKESETPPGEKPVPSSDSEKAEGKGKKKLSKGALAGIISGAAVLVIVIVVAIVLSMQAQATAKYNEYVDNLDSLATCGLQAASTAESICNTTKSVWYSAIWNDDKTWDADIEKYHASDFNDALAKMYADSSVRTKISNMKANASEVESLMGKLKNPPDPDLEDAYEAAKDFADSVEDLVDLAADPSGSLNTFSSNFSTADDACAKALKELSKEIPEKK